KKADEAGTVVAPAEPVKGAEPSILTEPEKKAVEDAVKKANPNLPEGATVEVGKDGTVTVKDKDGKELGKLKPEETVKKAGAATSVDKNPLEAEVAKKDATKASDKYKNADKDKKDAYDKALADAEKVLADPNASQDDVNKAKKALEDAEKALNGKASGDADKIGPNIPGNTEVGNKDKLTEEEKSKIAEKIKEANKDKFPAGTKVTVDEKGNATITYPNGSKDVIGADKLIKEKASGNESGGNIGGIIIPGSKADEGDKDNTSNEDDNKKKLTEAEKYPVKAIKVKAGARDMKHLTDDEKHEVIDKVKKANPAAIDVIVDDKGNATLIYADGSKNFINAEDLIFQVAAQKEKMPNAKANKAGKNVKTGVGSVSGIVGLAGISIAGLLASRKKEEEDK
ncbi:hypothetical protein ACCQ42_10265, partial [Anaerococcus sp. ENR0874]